MTASIARKSVTVAEYSLPSGEGIAIKEQQGGQMETESGERQE